MHRIGIVQYTIFKKNSRFMKILRFEKVIFRNHKIVNRSTIATWHNLTPRTARAVCQNFYDGFCLALNQDYRKPTQPWSMGYTINSWNLHKEGCGWQYRFVNGRNQIIKFK